MRIFWANPIRNILKMVLSVILAALALLYIVKGFEWRTHWDQIIQRNSLIVAVRESEGIFWANGQDFNGFEHDLIKELEEVLGVPIQIFAVRDLDDLYRALQAGAVDIALSGTSTPIESPWISSRPYAATRIGLVHHKDYEPDAEQIRTGILDPNAHRDAIEHVLANGERISAVYEHGRLSAELFTLLDLAELEQVLIDERDFNLQQNIFPDLRFTPLDVPTRPISILFTGKEDGTLKKRINAALDDIDLSGLLSQMNDRYFGQALEFDYVDNLTFERHMAGRLPEFEALFREYAAIHDMDWRLLAAVAYQESHWRADARSPTGVRGLMMVTMDTARDMGITDRRDPVQSVQAGSQYLTNLYSRLPERITDPDRTWFSLAAYNVGLGHLEDARKITQILGDDPDRWIDVRKHLPKLALKDYYPWTKHGYARGNEPVVYVANIRRFYDRLIKEFPEQGEAAEPERLEQLPDATVPLFPSL